MSDPRGINHAVHLGKWFEEIIERRKAEMMSSGGETTLEEDIIYHPEIVKLLEKAEDRILVQLDRDPEPAWEIKNTLQSLVYNAIREWTGE